jgi:antitoxin PrlF
MNRRTATPTAFSRVSVKSQTVIPREVRAALVDKAPASESDDPFAAFSEWTSEADEKAYGDL